MADSSSFTKLVPGFEFLQGLVKNAGAALPNIGQWVAPTLNPEELEKRIEELRTVQFWLEQNARMLAATIQALEVQRMTLSTLKTMNVQMEDLRESLTIKLPEAQATSPAPAPAARKKADAPPPAAAAASAAMNAVDPMQWWGALTKQFTELAATAMKETATDAAKNLAASMVKQSFDAAGQTLKTAVGAPAKAAKAAGQAVSKAAAGAASPAGSSSAAAAAPAPAKKVARKRAAPKSP